MDMGSIICAISSNAALELGKFHLVGSAYASANHDWLAAGSVMVAGFSDSTRKNWWDDRCYRVLTSRFEAIETHQPDEVLWLNELSKPARVRRPVGYEGGVTVETLSKICQQGHITEAVEALGVLVQTDCRVSQSVFYTVLKNCVAQKNLVLSRIVHALSVKEGYGSDTFLCNNIMRMYAAHGRLSEAMEVFAVVAQPDSFSWSAIISAHVKQGQDKKAIELYRQMRRSSVKPDGHVFVAALQACARVADLETGQQVHADVLASGLEPHLFVLNSLMDMYAKCGSLEEAQRVFDGLGRKNVVTWTVLIAGYFQQGKGQEALHLYGAMQKEGITAPDAVTLVRLLQACVSVGTAALDNGKQLHAQVRDQGLEADVFVASSLLHMYAKCGSLEDAQGVFDGLPQKDVVIWNAMIAGYSQQGKGKEALRLYRAMQEEGIVAPDSVTFLSLLQACASIGTPALEKGKQLHARVKELGLEADVFVASCLVSMYAKCGSLQDAQRLFDGLPQKDVVMWNAMIAGYSEQCMGQEALRLYSALQEEGITAPNCLTFVCLLQACANLGIPALENGKQLHAQIVERGLQSDVSVANSLVNMYGKCGSLKDAQGVFDGLGQKNVVTWNAMIGGYSQQGMGQEALCLYRVMREGVVAPNSVTFACLLQACANVGGLALETGRQLHSQIQGQQLEADIFLANSLVNMYAKCESLEEARSVFDGLGEKNVVTWNAMIAGYSQQGMGREALGLYSAMQEEGILAPDSATFVFLLQACASVGTSALEKGKQLHAQIRGCGLETDVFVANTLVDMYAKCGSLDDAQSVFDGLGEKNVVTWTAMIAGYSQQGMGQEALHLYRTMQGEGIVAPNSVTYVCLLQACGSVAALDLGRQLHAQIKDQGLDSDACVAVSLIDMYAKSGGTVDAQQVFEALPQRDVVTWNALIAGYTRQGDSDAVFNSFHKMREDGIQPSSITFLSVLTACSHAGLVNKGREFFKAISSHYGITPTGEHYTCMVDLLGRAGHVDEALSLVRTMPVPPDSAVWHTLLGACRKWKNVKVGQLAFNEALKLDQKDPVAYVSMSNIYAGAQMWEQAQEMQARRTGIGAWKQPGQSWWTDEEGLVHTFLMGDEKHPESEQIYTRLKDLISKTRKQGLYNAHPVTYSTPREMTSYAKK